MDYEIYIRRCLELAKAGEYYVAPNPMVGAVLAESTTGRVVAEGWHHRFGEAHAEVDCLSKVGTIVNHAGMKCDNNTSLPKTLFVNLEPCSHWGKTPPCADLIIRRREELKIERVVVGSLDPNPEVAGRGVRRLQEAGIEVVTGVLEKECRYLNRRFMCLHEEHRPYVVLKWAQTADGYIGSPDRRVVISNSVSKQIVHKMRAENMAIMVGANTALTDNPKLLNTHWSGRNPIRVLLDHRHRVPESYNIFSGESETIVYSDDTRWEYVLSDLASRGIHSVLVEGGATVLNNILETGIYDEVHVEVNPNLYLNDGIKAPALQFGALFERTKILKNTLYTYEKHKNAIVN